MSSDGPVLALDVGGTKLAAGLVEPSGRVLARREVPTPAVGVWPALRGLALAVASGVSVAGVGIGCGGPADATAGTVSPVNIAEWRAFPLRERVSSVFPGVTVRLHNDAVCFAAGEHWLGAGAGSDAMVGVVVSTGVGGGLVLGGRVLDGRTGNAGHLGHVCVEPGGPVCGCGAAGCLEAVASGPSLVRWARLRGWTGADGVALTTSARAGDAVALAAFTRAGDALGLALAGAATLLDLDAAVVGGGLAAAGELLFAPLRAAVARHARLGYTGRFEVRPAALGRDGGLVGAAALVLAPSQTAENR